jgi:hypothetical protein
MIKPAAVAAVLGGLLVGFSVGRLTRSSSLTTGTPAPFVFLNPVATRVEPGDVGPWDCMSEDDRLPETGCPMPPQRVMSVGVKVKTSHSGFADAPTCGTSGSFDVAFQANADGQMVPVDPSQPLAFAAYRGQLPEKLSDDSVINGVHMQMGQLHVNDSCDEVAQGYMSQLLQNDIHPMHAAPANDKDIQYLSFRPAGSKFMKTITLVPQNGRCVVLASIGDPVALQKAPTRLPEGVPNLSRTRDISVTESRDGDQQQVNINYTGTSPSLKAAAQSLTAQMKEMGYTEEKSTFDGETSQMWRKTFSRGQSSMTFTVACFADGADVFVTIFWVQS